MLARTASIPYRSFMSIDRNGGLARRRQRAQWAGAVLTGMVLATLPGFGGALYLTVAVSSAATILPSVLAAIPVAIAVGAVVVLLHAVSQRPTARPMTVAGAVLFSLGAVAQVGASALAATPQGYSPVLWMLGAIAGMVGAVLCLGAWIRTGPAGRESFGGDERTSGGARRVWMAAAISSVACLGVAALVTVDALEWGPRSQTDGLGLDEILARLNEVDVASARAGLAIGLALAFALCATPWLAAWLMRRRSPRDGVRVVSVTALVAVGGIVLMQTLGSFSLGMSIADTLPPYVGSQSPQWQVFFPIGTLLACVGITLALGWARAPAAPAQSAAGLRKPVPIA